MNKAILQDISNDRIFFLDGAMGTMLQKSGLKLGERPEILSLTDAEAIEKIHREYIKSGSQIIYANTFGANAHKLAGTGYEVKEVITAAVKAARRAAASTDTAVSLAGTVAASADTAVSSVGTVAASSADTVYVALDVGPIGELLEPYGTLTFESAYEIFKEMIVAGDEAGADLIVFETMTDLYEVKAGVLAAKENCELPVFVTMTFEANHRTFTGCSVEAMACTLEGLGVDALGINCSLGPDEIFPIAAELSSYTALPLIIKANAGLPDPETETYSITADLFAESMKRYSGLNIKFVGGCCGTTPEYITAMKKVLEGAAVKERIPVRKSRVCTPTSVVEIDGVRVIGERINPTGKKRFRQALLENDTDYIINQGIQQAEAGADILDVNVGLPEIDEPQKMVQTVKSLQAVLDLPLQLDSSDAEAIEAGLRVYNGKPIVNSVNGEPEVMERIFPLIRKYGAAVVGLTLDDRGIPPKAEDRFAIAEKIVDTALSFGIPKEDIFIDCLTLTVSAQQAEAAETLKAVRMVKERLGVRTVLGVSNISFGLPYRDLINHSFLMLAMGSGLDLPIINPNAESMMNAVMAFNVLSNRDRDSAKYIEKFADYAPQQTVSSKTAAPVSSGAASYVSSGGSSAGPGQADSVASAAFASSAASAASAISAGASSDRSLSDLINHAVEKGLKEEAVRATTSLLEDEDEMTVVNQHLIPALDRVGTAFEKGKLFLPQLLNAAAAASEAFEVIKKKMAASGQSGALKEKILIATVKGDIHDIGKNIVKVILENYGYQVIDLGRDVPPEDIVRTAVSENVRLVGLSALMTTTLKSMEDTIAALRASGHDCKIMVGGAVLTPEYAEKMGADFYAKDAKESADIAKEVLG